MIIGSVIIIENGIFYIPKYLISGKTYIEKGERKMFKKNRLTKRILSLLLAAGMVFSNFAAAGPAPEIFDDVLMIGKSSSFFYVIFKWK